MSIKVTPIPAKKPIISGATASGTATRRVAAYARVSTANEEQATSYVAQVDYYTQLINSRADWKLVEIYTDEGITGTSTKHRAGFQKMVADALAGEIDLIVTKSVSRFARNTVDSLTTVRSLKEAGVEIYFEKENIWTLDAKGELLITIMSSLAQEESRSISENVRWGVRKRFADGQVTVPYPNFLGYQRGSDGRPQIVEDEAKLVRRIYRMFLAGQSFGRIADTLTAERIPSPGKPNNRWYLQTVASILQNEKYRGDALLQKTYIQDFLTKKQVKNQGEVAQYYVTGSHEAIIDPETFDLVQHEIRTRKGRRTHYPFTQKLQCEVCGAWYGSKVWHSNDPYRAVIWQCNNKYKVEHPKPMPHPTSPEIETLFLDALNNYLAGHKQIAANIEAAILKVMDTSALEAEQADLAVRMEGLAALMTKAVEDNSRRSQNQEDYQQRFSSLEKDHAAASARYQAVVAEIESKQGRAAQMRHHLNTLNAVNPPVVEFDERLWHVLIDHATINPNGDITFLFKWDSCQ
ncbi:recombinase family protein [Actinomycetaceae bacterium WB03_NA08]|uniref:Recombinase family protein n=1 Tax=Scrofimicrobium canadense TaxID=2652290 RepID=A0A6N7VUG2_9ACTO|nr:recombinase family protein [Scrofimicrobium canadense]MSS85429.1 recombinase family protein [Scrofimicrobium canadense]